MNVKIGNVETVDLVSDNNIRAGTRSCSIRFNSVDDLSVTVIFDENSIEAVHKAKHALSMVEDFLARK